MTNRKKVLWIALTSVCSLCACQKSVALGKVENIAYEDGILSYDEVERAEGYHIAFAHAGEIVFEDRISDTSIDVESLGLKGNITFSVSAYSGETTGETTVYEFTVLTTFGDIVFEAEDYLANYGTGKEQCNFRNNILAHNGAYVGGIDDAGQGVYIDYLCPIAGTYTLESYYTTAMPVAHDDVWVNGKFQAKYDYTINTGWGGDTYNAEKAEVEITLQEGWNTISVMKNGDSNDNWGSFVELDYFVLKGSGEEYNVDDLAKYGPRPSAYRLEAEMGSPRRKNKDIGLYECKNPCIAETEENQYSNGFLMGNIESNYDGVEWQFNSPVKATYKVEIAYASGAFEGSSEASPSFVVTQEEVGLTKNIDFLDHEIKTIGNLPYTGWNQVAVANKTVEITLEQGKNFIYCLKLDSVGSGFFQIDYVDLTFVSEVQ